jgi:hypothetical protein
VGITPLVTAKEHILRVEPRGFEPLTSAIRRFSQIATCSSSKETRVLTLLHRSKSMQDGGYELS